jgi:transcription elongation factor GreB
LSLLNQTIDDLEKERETLIAKKDDPMVKQKIAVIERDMRYFAARIDQLF